MIMEALFVSHTEQGVRIVDQIGNPWTRAMWVGLRKSIDAYFETLPDEEIARERQEFYDRCFNLDNRITKPSARTASKPQTHKPGYIYLLHGEGTDWYKIGISVQPDYRVKLIGAKAPFPIVTIACYDVEDMKDAEEWWHETFAHKRTNGEWFELEQPDIELFVGQEGRPLP